MIIILLLIAILSFILVLLNIKNKFSYLISAKFIVLSFVLLCGLIYISKVSQYRTPFSFDYHIFLYLNQMKIDIKTISRLYNIGFAVEMSSSAFLLYAINKAKIRYLFLVISLPVLFFVYATDYLTAYNVYIAMHSPNPNTITLFLHYFSDIICNVIFVAFLTIPYIFSVVGIVKSKIFTRRKHLLIVTLSYFLIDTFAIYVLRFSIYKNIAFDNVNFAKIPNYSISCYQNTYTVIGLLYLLVFITIVLLLYHFRPFSLFFTKSGKESVLLAKTFNKNLSMQFHVYKNAFLSAGQQFYLIDKQLELENYELARSLSKDAINNVNEYISILENNLKVLSEVSNKFYDVDLIECINASISDISKDTNIEIVTNFERKGAIIRGNSYYLEEAIRNLLLNAMDAIINSGRKGKIEINLIYEHDFYMLEVIDNGIGIEKKYHKQIFELFYSTKPNNKGSGVGLNYVKTVVAAYGGEIRVKSIPENFTQFQLSFPEAKPKNYRILNRMRNKMTNNVSLF